METLKDRLLLQEALISNIKNTSGTNLDRLKKDLDGMETSKYFTIFPNETFLKNHYDNDVYTEFDNTLKKVCAEFGTIKIKNSEFGKELLVDLDRIKAKIEYTRTIYIDYIGLWNDLGIRKISFTGSLENRYMIDNQIGIYGIADEYNDALLKLPAGIQLNIEHKDYDKCNITFQKFYGIENDVKYHLQNFYFYNSNFHSDKVEHILSYLSSEHYYKNGNYNSLGFPIRIVDFFSSADFNRIEKFTGEKLRGADRFSDVVNNDYAYRIMYKHLKNSPYFPITNIGRLADCSKSKWNQEKAQLIFYVPGTEADGKKQVDKHLKDPSNPYNNFEFITYNGNSHKTKKEENELKSGGFVVLSL